MEKSKGFYEKVKTEIKKKREQIWLNRPKELQTMMERRGTKGMRWPIVTYVESETRALTSILGYLRTASRTEGVTIESLRIIAKAILRPTADIYEGWYGLNETSSLLRNASKAIDAIESMEEFKALIEELLMYINKLNFWVDTMIPWHDMSSLYEWISKRNEATC